MKFLALLLMLLSVDKGVEEKIVVVDHVDMVEVNHKYFESDQSVTGIKLSLIHI